MKRVVEKAIGAVMMLIPLVSLFVLLYTRYGICETLVAFGVSVIFATCISTGLRLLLK